MTRIDAGRGTIAGVSPGRRTPLITSGAEQLSDGLAAVAGVLKDREIDRDRKEAVRQESADRVTLAKAEAGFRERLTPEFDNDADAYDGAEPGFSDRWRERLDKEIETETASLDPRLADAARLRFQNVRDNFALASIRLEDAKRDGFVLKGIGEVAEAEFLGAQRDPSSLAERRANIDSVVEAAPGDRDSLRKEYYERLGAATLAGFEKANPGRGLDALDGGDFDRLLPAEQQALWRNRLNDEMDRRAREADRQAEKIQRQASSAVKEELGDIYRLRKLGLPVSDERYDALSRVATIAGDDTPALVDRARSANRAGEEVKKMPFAGAVAAVSALRTELSRQTDVRPEDAQILEAAEASLSGMKKQMSGDFLAFAAANRGGVDPLDFNDPVASLKRRASVAKEQADYYGAPKVRFFTDNELASIKGLVESDKGRRALFIDAVAAAGAPEMLKEIAPAAPTIAHVAGLKAMGGDAGFVNDVLRGGDLRKEKALASTVDRTAIRAPAIETNVFGSAFALRPEAKARAIESAGLAYDAWSADLTRGKDDFDGKEYKLALQRAAGATGPENDLSGGVTTLRNRPVAVPPYVRQRDFQRLWTVMPQDQWALGNGRGAFDEDGREIPPAELRRMHPVAVDSGVYILNSEREGAPIKWPVDEAGKPWRFDINKIRDAVITASTGDQNGENSAN